MELTKGKCQQWTEATNQSRKQNSDLSFLSRYKWVAKLFSGFTLTHLLSLQQKYSRFALVLLKKVKSATPILAGSAS